MLFTETAVSLGKHTAQKQGATFLPCKHGVHYAARGTNLARLTHNCGLPEIVSTKKYLIA